MLTDILTLAIMLGLVLGFIHIMSGKFLDIKVIKEEIHASSSANFLLHSLLTRSNILVKDLAGTKIPYVVNNSSLNNEIILNFYKEHPLPIEFKLEIVNVTSSKQINYTFEFFNFNFSNECLLTYYKPAFSEARILLCNNSLFDCEPSVARIIAFESPLTRLADEVSKACIRRRVEDAHFIRLIPVDYSQIEECKAGKECCGITLYDYKLCICTFKGLACFPTACNLEEVSLAWRPFEESCDFITINVTDKVYIEIPYEYATR